MLQANRNRWFLITFVCSGSSLPSSCFFLLKSRYSSVLPFSVNIILIRGSILSLVVWTFCSFRRCACSAQFCYFRRWACREQFCYFRRCSCRVQFWCFRRCACRVQFCCFRRCAWRIKFCYFRRRACRVQFCSHVGVSHYFLLVSIFNIYSDTTVYFKIFVHISFLIFGH